MHTKTVAAKSNPLPSELRFRGTPFTADKVIELASDAKPALHRALVDRALFHNLITLDDLKEKYRYFNEELVSNWRNDSDVIAYGSQISIVGSNTESLKKVVVQAPSALAAPPPAEVTQPKPAADPNKVVCGPWELDLNSQLLRYGEKSEHLDTAHAQVLMVLMRKSNQNLSFMDICEDSGAPSMRRTEAMVYLAEAIMAIRFAMVHINSGSLDPVVHVTGIGYRFKTPQ